MRGVYARPDARMGRPMKRLLLVDDDDDMRTLVRDLLTESGFAVDEAQSGLQALKLLHAMETPPCLVLLDMAMPGMSGLEVLSELRATPKLADVAVVSFTAHAQTTPPRGVRALIRKPIDSTARLMLVRKFSHDL